MISPTSTATTTATATANATPSQASSVLSSDFETFLLMLTTQARYQDPLEPIDSSEFSSQLAQFSMVEQQVLSNDLLTALSGQLGTGNIGQMASWIGMEALTSAPVSFEGSPITINPNPAAAADQVFLVVYDNRGNEIQREAIPASTEPLIWAGVSDDGTPFPHGTYSFGIESYADDELILSDPAETYARITEARLQDGETILILDGGAPVLASAVTGLRDPS